MVVVESLSVRRRQDACGRRFAVNEMGECLNFTTRC